jgi:hypothetical protein
MFTVAKNFQAQNERCGLGQVFGSLFSLRSCARSSALPPGKKTLPLILGLKIFSNRKGQTTVEYLMLLGATFITAYIMITGPFATFTSGMVAQIKTVTGNIVRNGEMSGKGVEPGSAGHPAQPNRFKAVHL